MSKTYKDFILQSKPLTDKNESINDFVTYAIDKLESMFIYDGLPDTIPAKWLEYYLLVNGSCFVAKVNGDLYALIGSCGGEYDAYYQPTRYIVSNPYLNLSKDFEIDVDGVLIRNDTFMNGMLPIMRKYGSLLTEADLTMRTGLINMRIMRVITASDENSKQSADEYMNKVENGELKAIGENPFFEGVKLQDGGTFNGYLQSIIEATQYIKASFYNEIGLNANYNLKREYISDTENSLADDILLPLIDNMLNERVEAIDKINSMYGTSITVSLASSWKTNDKEDEKEVAQAENAIEEAVTPTTGDEPKDEPDEPKDEPADEPKDEPADEPKDEPDEPADDPADEPDEPADEPADKKKGGDDDEGKGNDNIKNDN